MTLTAGKPLGPLAGPIKGPIQGSVRVTDYAVRRRVKVCATVDVNHLLKIVSGVSRVVIGRADTVGVTTPASGLRWQSTGT